MISNQILQNTIEGLKGITRIDFCVMDTDGKSLASTFAEQENYEEEVVPFVESPADSQEKERMLALLLEELNRKRTKRGKEPLSGQSCPASLKKHLADGPGKLCTAMGITRADNDVDMVESQSLYVTEGIKIEPERIQAGKRIGIDYAEEAAEYLWRFYL